MHLIMQLFQLAWTWDQLMLCWIEDQEAWFPQWPVVDALPARSRHENTKGFLTLWRPPTAAMHMGTAIKHPVPDWVKPSLVIFWHPGTLTLRAERQSARMSKITNDRLTSLAKDVCNCTHMATVGGRQRVKVLLVDECRVLLLCDVRCASLFLLRYIIFDGKMLK